MEPSSAETKTERSHWAIVEWKSAECSVLGVAAVEVKEYRPALMRRNRCVDRSMQIKRKNRKTGSNLAGCRPLAT